MEVLSSHVKIAGLASEIAYSDRSVVKCIKFSVPETVNLASIPDLVKPKSIKISCYSLLRCFTFGIKMDIVKSPPAV